MSALGENRRNIICYYCQVQFFVLSEVEGY